MDNRRAKMLASERAQEYFFDASQVESWMSEQVSYMIVEDCGKDEISAQNVMKIHQTFKLAVTGCNFVTNYAETICSLGEIATQLIAEYHPDSDSDCRSTSPSWRIIGWSSRSGTRAPCKVGRSLAALYA